MWIDEKIKETTHSLYYLAEGVVVWVWSELPRSLLTAATVYAALKVLP